jgi:hypothetical protein
LRYAKERIMDRKMETDQFAELMSAVARSLPRDMDTTTVQGWITNQDALAKVLRDALIPFEEKPDETPRMTVGGRTYEILSFLQGEERVRGNIMVARAKDMNAHLGEDDGEYILAHQEDIPSSLRGKITFVFTDWQHLYGRLGVVGWSGDRWVLGTFSQGDFWTYPARVLRRK